MACNPSHFYKKHDIYKPIHPISSRMAKAKSVQQFSFFIFLNNYNTIKGFAA